MRSKRRTSYCHVSAQAWRGCPFDAINPIATFPSKRFSIAASLNTGDSGEPAIDVPFRGTDERRHPEEQW
jgi:hypothetical protein